MFARVPAALLLDSTLLPTTKIVWMFLSLQSARETAPLSQRALAAEASLARHTVRSGLERLAAAGRARKSDCGVWVATGEDTEAGRRVQIPTKLLKAEGVNPQARVLYGGLQLVPGFTMGTAQCTYQGLSRLMGLAPRTIRRAVQSLEASGWLEVRQANKHAPIELVLTDPDREREEWEVNEAERKLKRAGFKGEAIMFAYLDLLVASDDYQDHARPAFLINEFTGELMELDRFYPTDKVAFEFNGAQHYHPTDRYGEVQHRPQLQRDDIKRGICKRCGINLVVVRAADLTLERMRRKVEGQLPLRDLTRHKRLSEYLELTSRGYRREALGHTG